MNGQRAQAGYFRYAPVEPVEGFLIPKHISQGYFRYAPVEPRPANAGRTHGKRALTQHHHLMAEALGWRAAQKHRGFMPSRYEGLAMEENYQKAAMLQKYGQNIGPLACAWSAPTGSVMA